MKALILIFMGLNEVYLSNEDEKVPKPEKCGPNAITLYRLCCLLPPFFTQEVVKSCGGVNELIMYLNTDGGTSLQRNFADLGELKIFTTLKKQKPSDGRMTTKTVHLQCAHWYCMLDKYGFISRTGLLDHERFFNHLEIWATLNPMFTGIANLAKIHCKQLLRFYFPLKPCEFFKLNMCIRNYMSVNCPVKLLTKKCTDHRKYYKECEKYY